VTAACLIGRRRLVAVVALAAVAVALATSSDPAVAATPICSAALFEPVDGNGAYMVEQPESASGAIFCDSTGGAFDFELATAPHHGALSALAANGLGGASFTYTPTAAFAGADSFILSAREGDGEPVEIEVDVRVRLARNDPPVCTTQMSTEDEGDGYQVATGTPATGSIDCFDDEGAELSFAVHAQPEHGTLSAITQKAAATGSFTYTPDPGYEGSDTFSFVADDGTQDSAPAVVEVAVAAPVAHPLRCDGTLATTSDASGIYEAEQGKTVHGTVACVAEAGADLEISVGSPPSHGSLAPFSQSAGDGADFAYTPVPGYLGFDGFQIDVSDRGGPAVPVTVQLRVVPERDDPPECTAGLLAPVAGGAYRVKQGATVEGELDCEDDEGEPLSYAVAGAPQHGSIGAIGPDGRFSYIAPTSYLGPDELSLVADDGTQDSRPVVLEIAVTEAVNEPPDCEVTLGAGANEAGAYLVDRDTEVEGQIVCTDDNDADPAPAVGAAPLHGSLGALVPEGPGAATFTYTPEPGFMGTDAFSFTADDGNGASTTTTVTVEVVEPGPDVPHCSARLDTATGPDGYEVESGETVSGTLTCFDAEGRELSYSVARSPGHGAIAELESDGAGAHFTFTADAGWTGADSFGLVASNGEESSGVLDFDIAVVTPVDDPPVCSIALFSERQPSGSYPAEAGAESPGVVSCVDDENEPLTFTVTGPPQHGSIVNLEDDGESAMFDYRADPGHVGPEVVTLTARDPAGGEDVVTLDLEVEPAPNTAPVCTATLAAPFAAGTYTVEAGAPTSGQITCQDAEFDPLTFSVVQAPSRGTLGPLSGSGNSRSFTYTGAPGNSGADQFIFKANDGSRDSDPVTVALLVKAAEGAPPGGEPSGPDGEPSGPGDGGSTGTGTSSPALGSSGLSSPPSTTARPPARPAKPKPKKCRKGFTTKTVRGKAKCVKKHPTKHQPKKKSAR
jgi:large repetitive protein